METTISQFSEDRYTHRDLSTLRLDGLPLLLITLSVASLGFSLLPLSIVPPDQYWIPLVAPFVPLAIFIVYHRDASLASAVLVTCSLLAWAAGVWAFPETAIWLAPLMVGVWSTLLGPRGAFVAASLVSLISAMSVLGSRLTLLLFLSANLTDWTIAGLFWLTARPVITTVEWAWASWADARRRHDHLREQQGELNQTIHNLDIAYRRLEHLNDELSQARRLAEEAYRAKSAFAASISHELRTPLNLILGFSELMVRTPHAYGLSELPPAYQADVEAIYRNAQHLAELVDDVLDLSQAEAGRMRLLRERTALAGVVDGAVRVVTTQYDDLGLSLDVEVPSDLPTLALDRTRVRQVLINLLNNAARFTRQGGVRVRAERRENEVVVSVADTGSGIASEDLPHVFDEFYQSTAPARRRAGGSGLGLTISKRLIELHGGAMWVDSKPGEGSTFSFSLPLAPNVVTHVGPGDWEVWDRLGRQDGALAPAVAVVSADEAVQRLSERCLDGYRVLAVGTLQEAQALTSDANLHGVVVAAGSLEECSQSIRLAGDLRPSVPVAVASLMGAHDLASRLGVAHYLVKPITRQQVVRALDHLGKSARTILVVDDSVQMVRLLERMIRSVSPRYQVLQATSGHEALAIMGDRPPDAVFLDLIMPDVDGQSVIARMRADASLSSLPIVVVSASQAEVEVPSTGMVGITRPGGLSIDEMMDCIKACFSTLQAAPGRRSSPAP